MAYCFIICTAMTLLVGLRHSHVGQGDTYLAYIPEFERIQRLSFAETFAKYKDPFYYLSVKAFQLFSLNPYDYLFVYAIPYNVAISWLIYHYSKYPALSYSAVLGLSVWKIAFTGMRHVVAAAFLIFSFAALVRNKKILHWILIGIAALFHSSALIFLIAYPMTLFKDSEKLIPVTIVLAIAAYFARTQLMSALGWVLVMLRTSDRYMRFSRWKYTGSIEGYLLNLLIFAILLLVYRKAAKAHDHQHTIKNNPYLLSTGEVSFRLLNSMQMITLFFYSTSVAINESSRISTFFGIVTALMIPQYLDLEKNKKIGLLIRSVVIVVFCLLFLFVVAPRSNLVPYYFNWQKYVE